MNILFVCSMGKLRSRTCADHFRSRDIVTNYVGTDQDADHKPTKALLEWADVIVCMERSHRSKLRRKFKGFSHKMTVWNIPDEFYYMDPMLIILIEEKRW